jgi:glyoxylate reductase
VSLPRVFVSRILPDAGLEEMHKVAELDIWPESMPPDAATLRERCQDAVGLVSLLTDRVDAALMDACPNLRVISQFAVGHNNIDVAAATERGIAVGNTPDVLTDATADMAFCLMMAAGRRLLESAATVPAGGWKTWEPTGFIGSDFMGKTVGVVGMGRIGQAFARRCHGAFGMEVLYTGRKDRPEIDAELGARRVDLDELLASSDFVSAHTALTDDTREMFNGDAFARMRPNAVFVNTARGEVVDQDALVQALREGEIFAAGLDVTTPEPLPTDHALLSLSNCIIAPHIGSATVESRNGMARIAASNLAAGLKGEALPCPVNPDVKPRS